METMQAGCLICGEELVYAARVEERECIICRQVKTANCGCPRGHFICDACHKAGAEDVITALCMGYSGNNPVRLAMQIMDSPSVKMHGPEHHYLVPAVLITAYYNARNMGGMIPEKLALARERARIVPGGFCGFYGNCGAGVGTGIYMSVVTGATPLSSHEWKLSNLMTADSLKMIAEAGGPRCCKRDTFIAVTEAIGFTEKNLQVSMEREDTIRCSYFKNNKQCLSAQCRFYNV